MNDRYTVDTPENIEFAYDIAGIGSRFLAAIIDTLLIGIGQAVVLYVFGVMSDTLGATGDLALAIAGLLSFAILWGYYITFEMIWNGQSPGKRAIGLRVVREGGRPLTFLGSAIRNLIRIIDFLPAFYGIGVITMFVDARARRLGDLAGGTLVVKERRAITLESLTSAAAPVSTGASEAARPVLPNIELITSRDYDLVQEFLQRRNELSTDARARVSTQLASGLQARLGLPQGGDAERFLQYVAGQYRLLEQQER